MRTLAILTVAVLMCAGAASADLVAASPHYVVWEDYFGDWHDNYMEVERGGTYGLSILVNRTGGSANGGLTQVRWDPAVMSSVTEDTSNTYWRQYYPVVGSSTWTNPDAFQVGWFDNSSAYAIGEGQYINRVNFNVAADAPIGTSTIELWQTMMYYGSYGNDAQIFEGDPFAMQVNVVPEPATMSLLALGGLAMLKRRK